MVAFERAQEMLLPWARWLATAGVTMIDHHTASPSSSSTRSVYLFAEVSIIFTHSLSSITVAMVILLAVPSKLAQLSPSIPTLIPKRTQEWKNGLCSCSPGYSCVLSLLFPDFCMLDLRSAVPISGRLMSLQSPSARLRVCVVQALRSWKTPLATAYYPKLSPVADRCECPPGH